MARGRENQFSKFLIRHEKLDLGIYLSSSNLHLLHEETIPERVTELKESLVHDVVKDPVVVDADSLVVLDGMHGVAALREPQCLRVPVCAVDYFDPKHQKEGLVQDFVRPIGA